MHAKRILKQTLFFYMLCWLSGNVTHSYGTHIGFDEEHLVLALFVLFWSFNV